MALSPETIGVIYGSSIGAIASLLSFYATRYYDRKMAHDRMVHEREQLLATKLLEKKMDKGEAMLAHIASYSDNYIYIYKWRMNCERCRRKIENHEALTEKERKELVENYCDNSEERYSIIVDRLDAKPLEVLDELMDLAKDFDNKCLSELEKIRKESVGWRIYFITEDPLINTELLEIYRRIDNLPKMELNDGRKIEMMEASDEEIEAFEQEIDEMKDGISVKVRDVIESFLR